MRYLDKLSEAKKRGYTYQEVDAYARGREKATIARRKKEFEDFKDEVIKKSKEEKKKKVEEARTIPRQRGGGFSRATTSPDPRVSPTPESLEGGGLSKAERRKRMMKANKKKLKAEAYIQLGDTLAEAISSAVLGSQKTRDKRRERREAVSKGREEKTKKTKRVRDLKKEYRSLGRENSDLRNIKYREDEVKETEG